jgi:chromosome segregation ATPase
MKASALSYRVKAVGIQTKREGRNTFLTLANISLLDDLDKFLKENPSRTINEFLSLQRNYHIKPPTEDTLIHQWFTETPLVGQNLPDTRNQRSHIFKSLCPIEDTLDTTEQSVHKGADQEKDTAKDKEIAELKEEINKLKKEREEASQCIKQWQDTAIKAMNVINHLTLQLNNKNYECDNWKNLWSELVPAESIHYLFCKIGERVYLKTNYFDSNYAKEILSRRFSLFNRQN